MYDICVFIEAWKLTVLVFKSYSARTGRTVFSQLWATAVRHKANDGAIWAWFKYDTALSAVV